LPNNALPDGILLDLDDTIISYSVYSEPCWEKACELSADLLDGVAAGHLYDTVRTTRIWFWSDPERHRINRQNMRLSQQRVVSLALQKLGVNDWDLATHIADRFIEERQKTIGPFPGAIETLTELRNLQIPMVLVTNGASGPQREKINKFGLEGYFAAIFIEGECGYGKPDERIYHDALDALKSPPDRTWMVGDNLEWEIRVPQKLGIFSIWHDAQSEGLPEDSDIVPDRIITSLPELLPA
jgi:putative hydrolase of the HAD superfamily